MTIASPSVGIVAWIPSLLLMVLLSNAVCPNDAWADGELSDDLSHRSVGQLQDELSDIDAQLTQLARYSLQSGVGAIGYRSQAHADPSTTEWIDIVLPNVTTVDEVILVPAILKDISHGFTSDAFPIEFRVLASLDVNGDKDKSEDQI